MLARLVIYILKTVGQGFMRLAGDADGNGANWWLRSPNPNNANNAHYVNNNGNLNNNNVNNNNGVRADLP